MPSNQAFGPPTVRIGPIDQCVVEVKEREQLCHMRHPRLLTMFGHWTLGLTLQSPGAHGIMRKWQV